jgi:hypothetical protein
MAWLPYDYWASYEKRIADVAEFDECVRLISRFGEEYGRIYENDPDQRLRFFWRGQENLVYSLHSSLARALDQRGQLTEAALVNAEREIINEARRWLSSGSVPTAPALDVLALLQHHGAPTRLLDFTRDPYMALFFAVEKNDANPGRVIAIGVPESTVNLSTAEQTSFEPAWWNNGISEWDRLPRVWEPVSSFPRLRAQQGVFLIGGVPSNVPRRNMIDPPTQAWRELRATEIRHCMSVPFSLVKFDRASAADVGQRTVGQPPRPPIGFTIRVEGSKAAIREHLQNGVPAIDHANVYPDEAGFAAHAESIGRVRGN